MRWAPEEVDLCARELGRGCPALQVLSLAHCGIGVEGAQALAAPAHSSRHEQGRGQCVPLPLPLLTRLRVLDVSHNNLRCRGVV